MGTLSRLPLLALAAALAAGPAEGAAGDFTCRNTAAEITCTAVRCEMNTDGFTPISLSREGGTLEVCAYSGCSKGRLDLIRTRGDLTLLHAPVPGGIGPAAVVYDQKQQIATLLWGGYALPMSCGQ